MQQVSIGQVENLEDLIRGLESAQESLEAACQEQIAAAERHQEKAHLETQNSEHMLEEALQEKLMAKEALDKAQEHLESAEKMLTAAESALSACLSQPPDENGNAPDCSNEAAEMAEAQAAVEAATAAVAEAQESFEAAMKKCQQMERRVELAKQALGMAEQLLERTRKECALRLQEVRKLIDSSKVRLAAARRALEAYLATNPAAATFYRWLHWRPEPGEVVTPDVLRDRLNLPAEYHSWLHEYLYDREPAYRSLVDKYRREGEKSQGDVERNLVNRHVRIHLSGAFAEQIVRYALAPLGGRIETQGRTLVEDGGRYTKTDLIVTDLQVPVIFGRGKGMGASAGGSIAVEVKCGKAEYLYSQKDHMLFQAEGHRQADAHCTICSRDIHDLPPEKEKELREALRAAGSPLVGMLPAKNEIDQSCIAFIQQGVERDGK